MDSVVDKEQYRSKLTDMQFKVAFEHGTEPPFHNDYYNSKKEGVYFSIASGAPLFSSKDKFDSGTGWPSFTKPLSGAPVKETVDKSHGMSRTEVSCSKDGVHLGHVFDDGPRAQGGLRYCINSASLKFVPKEELSAEQKEQFGF
uniref:Peptide-methionine (R)-S-oxide reductase n=1 Tax=Strombidium rassoulzadegani TaxID=1082188 RepID=A0A7S3CTE5_9SPIT